MGQEEGGSLRAEYAYDAAGHRTKSRDGDGVEVSLSYGLEGQIRTLTTERAREAGRITAIHAPEGGKEEYTYDAAGNLRTSKAALGGVVSYTYTSRGQVASRRDQFGHTEYFQYDKEGRQVVQVDRKGNRTQTRFNVYGKPVYQACTDRKGKRQVMGIWAYDDFGHLKEAKGGGFTYTYRHRPDGRLLGLNLYAYCANNPVRYFDPSGHQKKPNCPGTEGEAATDKQPGVEIESSRYSLPQGISQEQFSNASKLLRDRVGDISGDIVVQGSRAKGTAKPTSDIDIALRVSGDKFDSLINQYFKTPNPGSAKERTMLHAIETGKIQAGEAKLSGLRKELQEIFGMEVDISIIKQGGAFDNPPFIPFE